jgi:UDP-N-acetylmuramate dehydrogenase
MRIEIPGSGSQLPPRKGRCAALPMLLFLYSESTSMILQENVPLAPLTTLQVGGPARFFVEAATIDDIREAVAFSKSKRLSLFVLGGGSNLIVSDSGWPGLVLKIAIPAINHRHGHGTAYFDVGAGEDWDAFVATTVQHHCAGVECLSGIPGSVGGTPMQNVGAYGQEVSDTIVSLTALNLDTAEEEEFEKADCGFGYRTSVFNTTAKGRYVILRVTFALPHNGDPRLSYADLKKHFANWDTKPSLPDVRDAVLQVRASKGMVISPEDPDSRSAGSFFKNPVLTAEQFEKLKQRAANRNLVVPSYPALDAQRKVSAAWLVEQSGFRKGYGAGHAGISSKHALAIVNRGGATAAEILALKDEIQQQVMQTWGIQLDTEPVVVG